MDGAYRQNMASPTNHHALSLEATLKLAPKLPTSVAVSSFPDIQSAADTVTEIVKAGISAQCLELIDDVMASAMIQAGVAPPDALQPRPTLMLKLAGSPEQRKLDSDRIGEGS